MFRSQRRCRGRSMASAVVCCSILLLRHGGGGVLAQRNGGGDDDGEGSSGNTSSPTGAPASPEDDDASSQQYPDCPGYVGHIRDGYCDSDLNVPSCGWDGGDCCLCTCGQGVDSADELPHPCGLIGDGYDCQDPDVPADCEATPSPAASFGYPDCDGYMYNFQNSYCNDDLNNAECGWDGGDCCRCTCREYDNNYNYWYYGYNGCGSGIDGYNCLDPEAPTNCDTDSPTPSPAAASGYPGCEGWIFFIGDGACDSPNNNKECGWDGGDCCPCDCQDSSFSCGGGSTHTCLDPSSSCYGSRSTTSTSIYDVEDGYYDDVVTSSSLWDDSIDSEFDIADDGSSYGHREFSSSTRSESAGVQDITEGSSGSSFSDVEMVAVFLLAMWAFVFLGCTALAACGFLQRHFCCSPGEKNRAAARDAPRYAAGAAAGAAAAAASEPRRPSRPLREAVFYSVPQGPPSPATAAEAAGDWGLAAALRTSSATAPTNNVKRRALRLDFGEVGAQNSKRPDAGEVSRTLHRVRRGPPSPAAAAEAAGDRALAAALRISAAAARDDAKKRAHIGDQRTDRLEAGVDGAPEIMYADEAELGSGDYGTGGTGSREAGSTDGGKGREAARDDSKNDAELVWEEDEGTSTPAVTRARNRDIVTAEEKEEEKEHDIEGGAKEYIGGDDSRPVVGGAAMGNDDKLEGKENEEYGIEAGAIEENGVGEDSEDGAAETEKVDEDADGACTAVDEDGTGEETAGCAVEAEAAEKEPATVSAVGTEGVGEETGSRAVEDEAGGK